jgi:putative ABC transport system substrate-binding protein
MRRRDFITLVGGVIAMRPVAGHAAARPRIGVLEIKSKESDARNLTALREALRQLGYVEGKTTDIDYRSSNGDTDALTGLAQELVALKPNVVFTDAPSPTRAINRAAPNLPIVCVGFGETYIPSLAASFAHPGGSVTGIATDVEGIFGKLIELTIDAIPGIRRIGFLSNPAGASMAFFEQSVQQAVDGRGVEIHIERVSQIADLDEALRKLGEAKVQAIIVPPNGLLTSGRKRILELSSALRLPLIFQERDGVEDGGFASYGVDYTESYRRAATFIDKILRGAAPGDLPIEFSTKIERVINLKTAKTLGLTVPPALLDRADEVIE